MKTLLRAVVLSFLVVAFTGCGGAKQPLLDLSKYNSIGKTAVVVFSVPQTINYDDNPGQEKKTLSLDTLAKAVMKSLSSDGVKAATVTHGAFIEELNGQGLSLTVMSREEMLANEEFAALVKPVEPVEDEAKEEGSKWGIKKLSSLAKANNGPVAAVAATGLNQYGLPQQNYASSRTAQERKYLSDAAKALGVDALFVVADPGFSFSCRACVGGTGAASTGSNFIVDLVSSDGEILLSTKGSFFVTPRSTAIVGGVINPAHLDNLFIEHGKTMAKVYAKKLKKRIDMTKESMAQAKN